MKKKALYISIAIIIVLVFTNPSMKQLDEFYQTEPLYANVIDFQNSFGIKTPIIKGRLYNLLIASVYTVSCEYGEKSYRFKYVGIAGNFIRIDH